MSEIVRYTAGETEVTLSPQIIKDFICSQATRQEIELFLRLCEAQKLNPFIREVYLIKFGTSPASMVVGKDAMTKRAAAQPNFRGYQAGIVLQTPRGELIQREGSMVPKGFELVGGWCKVLVDGWNVPVVAEVSMMEYNTGKSGWAKMPATMIRKVALCQALREAFPNALGALYGAEEMGIKGELDETPIVQPTVNQSVSQGTVIDVTVEVAGLTREHQDEVWRLFRGRGDLVSALLQEAGRSKLEDINDAAFSRLMKKAKRISEEAGLGSDISEDTATNDANYGEVETDATEAPSDRPEDVFFEAEAKIAPHANADELYDIVCEHFGIKSLDELKQSDLLEVQLICDKHGITLNSGNAPIPF